VFLFEIDAATIDDDLGYLRGSGVVEIDKWFAVDCLLQDGKVSANAINIPATRNSNF
jgi:hypothetical protein